jgi:hypothetical protein
MRQIIIIILLAIIAFNTCEAQEKKWRTLTLTAVNSASAQTNTFLPQFSAALDYELFDGFAINSWNGFAYNSNFESSWFASQTTLDKRMGSKNITTLGLGFLYTTSGDNNLFSPIGNSGVENDLFLTIKVQYRIQL